MTQEGTAAAEMASLRDAVDAIREAVGDVRPRCALVLGTGLGALAQGIEVAHTLPYSEIPGFPLSTVEGHAGRLLIGRMEGVEVVALQGRSHLYEGIPAARIAFPIRVLKMLGADTLFLDDHINLLGDHPLIGPNLDELGPRFPDMSAAYDADLRALASRVALERGITLRRGVYVAVQGPSLETRAEYRMLRTLGADVVGMSTVPEVIAARHAGMRVLAVSIVTDQCLPDALEEARIEDILRVADHAQPHLIALFRGVMAELT